jgi:hypothetical protein
MAPWVERPTLDIDLDQPIDERFANIPQEAIEAGAELLAAIRAAIPDKARWLAPLVRLRTLNRFHGEMTAMARLAHADPRDVVLANICYDLLVATIGCSTVALASPGGPVVARNMDWWPEDILARASYLIRCSRRGEMQFVSASWPGASGVVTGMSRHGFAVVLNAVIGPERFSRLGYPVLLHLRRVLEDATSFDAALDQLSRQRLVTSALFTLVGSENRQRVVIERTPTRFALRWAQDDKPLFATNDYRLLFKPQAQAGPEIYQTTCNRYEALCEFFADWRPDREVEDTGLLYILTDARVIQDITAQHITMRPRMQEMHLYVPSRLVGPSLYPG